MSPMTPMLQVRHHDVGKTSSVKMLYLQVCAHGENHTDFYMLVMSMGAAGTSSSCVNCADLSGHL